MFLFEEKAQDGIQPLRFQRGQGERAICSNLSNKPACCRLAWIDIWHEWPLERLDSTGWKKLTDAQLLNRNSSEDKGKDVWERVQLFVIRWVRAEVLVESTHKKWDLLFRGINYIINFQTAGLVTFCFNNKQSKWHKTRTPWDSMMTILMHVLWIFLNCYNASSPCYHLQVRIPADSIRLLLLLFWIFCWIHNHIIS